MIFNGFEIIVNDSACIRNEWKQFRYPKTKKKRIREKWRKRYCNWRMEEIHFGVKCENKMYISTRMFNALLKTQE